MGVVKYPRLRLYWKLLLKPEMFANVEMSRNCFRKLRNCLHIVDVNQENDANDRLWKVRPLLSSFQKRWHDITLEEWLCIDGQIIPFKGKLDIKKCVKGKPKPWGVNAVRSFWHHIRFPHLSRVHYRPESRWKEGIWHYRCFGSPLYVKNTSWTWAQDVLRQFLHFCACDSRAWQEEGLCRRYYTHKQNPEVSVDIRKVVEEKRKRLPWQLSKQWRKNCNTVVG